MRKLYLIFLLSLFLLPAEAERTTKSFFNPEDTWEYLFVRKPWIFDDKPDWVDVCPVVFSSPEVVTRDGKEYRRFFWNWKKENDIYPKIESYFLLREDNGAYYIYIDPLRMRSRKMMSQKTRA